MPRTAIYQPVHSTPLPLLKATATSTQATWPHWEPLNPAGGLAGISACFYDGVCERSAVWDAVEAVGKATHNLDRVCRRLITLRPPTIVDEFAGGR